MSDEDKKNIILRVWCERYIPAPQFEANVMKTSEEIMIDLRPMANFTTNEISDYLIGEGYLPSYNGDEQVWMLFDTKND